jgi:hypothetical protein
VSTVAVACRRFLRTIRPELWSEEALTWMLSLDPGELLALRNRVEALGQEEIARTWRDEAASVQAARDF